jgi:hypothetical protein
MSSNSLEEHNKKAIAQFNEVFKDNENSLKTPQIRFYDFLFLKEGNDNSQFFALLQNLPKWSDVAKKSKSNAFLVTDKTTIKILKSTKLPPESGMTDKTYFYYLRKGGIKFTTIEKLIENLPRDNVGWKKLHGIVKELVDNGTVHPVAFRDLARPIVMMGSIGDHAETVTVQKELDKLVSSKLANAFKDPRELLPPFSIQASLLGTYIIGLINPMKTRVLLIASKTAHGSDSSKEKKRLVSKFSDYELARSPEVVVAKGSFIYFGRTLKNTLMVATNLKKNGSKNMSSLNTNKLASSLEQGLMHLGYNGENDYQTFSVFNAEDLGFIGSIHLKSWLDRENKELVGQFVPLINNSSQIGDFINPLKKPSPLSWDGIKNITKYLGERVTPPENKPLALTPSENKPLAPTPPENKPLALTPSENKPLDRAFWMQIFKNAAILMAYFALPPLSSAPAISAGNRGSAVTHLNQSSVKVPKLEKPPQPRLKSSKPQPETLLRRAKEENQPNNVTTGSQATKLDTNITQSRGSAK